MKLAAVVVAYYPDLELLKNNLMLISKQVDKIFLIDNTPGDSINIEQGLKFSCPISYIPLMINTGIAHAQNLGTRLAIESGCDQFIYFDQDSIPDNGMVAKLLSAQEILLRSGINLGVIGPKFIESTTNKTAKVTKHFGVFIYKLNIKDFYVDAIEVDYLISSGSMIRKEVFEATGYLEESLFIDWVDIEFCLRAAKLGFKNYVIPNAKMLHTLGDSIFRLGRFNLFHKHSELRNYYIVRNASYLVFHSTIPFYWRVYIAAKLPFYLTFFSITASSENRIKALHLLIKALISGARARLGRAF